MTYRTGVLSTLVCLFVLFPALKTVSAAMPNPKIKKIKDKKLEPHLSRLRDPATSPEDRFRAVQELAAVGKLAQSDLLQTLQDKHRPDEVQAAALRALRMMGDQEYLKRRARNFFQVMPSADTKLWKEIHKTTRQLPGEFIVPKIIPGIFSSDTTNRNRIIKILADHPRLATRELLGGMQERKEIQERIANVIQELGYPAYEELKRIVLGISDGSVTGAVKALLMAGEEGHDRLKQIVESDDVRIVRNVIRPMTGIGKIALPFLNDIIQTGSRTARANAAYALYRMGVVKPKVVPSLVELLNSSKEFHTKMAVETLSSVESKKAKNAVITEVVDGLSEVSKENHKNYTKVLLNHGKPATEALLTRLEKTKDKETARVYYETLQGIYSLTANEVERAKLRNQISEAIRKQGTGN